MNTSENKKIVIATHVYTTGPAQDLRDYLFQKKAGKLLFIGHPLFYDKKLKSSGWEIYEKGELKKNDYKEIKKIPAVVSYFKDIFLNVWWVFFSGEKWDLFVGSDNLNAFSGIILRRLGKVKKVVYYVIDYNPKRFNNNLLNKIYHWIDQFSVRYADETWNLSPRMEEGRKNYFNFTGGNQKVVPVGIWFDRIKRLDYEEIEKHTLVFMGHIIKKQGVQYILAAVPGIIKEIPDFKFLVIGGGDYLPELKSIAKELSIEHHVQFTGYIENHEEVEELMVKGAAAVALYEKYDEAGNLTFTNFSDPAKLKSYLASGLPVLLTDVPYNAKEIEEKGCGFIINQDKDVIAQKVIGLLRNEEELRKYRDNAVNYAKNFDWNVIFKEVIL